MSFLKLAVFQAEELAHFRTHSQSLPVIRKILTALDPEAVLEAGTRLPPEADFDSAYWKGHPHR